jgi:hypothetical protein
MPDLYLEVYDRQGEMVYSTRQRTIVDNLPRLITTAIPEHLAQQHGLLAA